MSIAFIRRLSATRSNAIAQARKSSGKFRSCFCKHRYYATLYHSHPAIATSNNVDNDQHLRWIFDDPSLWKHEQKLSQAKINQPTTGLLEHPHFTSIEGIKYATRQAIQRAQIIVERICYAPQNGPEEMRRIVRHLDRLSDTLCSVIDICEFLRNAHPDKAIMEAANQAYSDLCSYMNTLNVDTRIYQALSLVLQNKDIVKNFSADEYAAAIVFLKDFEKSGIHLPEQQREQFVQLSDKIIQLGREFIQMNPRSVQHIKVPKTALNGWISNTGIKGSKKDYVYVPTDSSQCLMLLKYAQDEEIRKIAYQAMNSATDESVMVLEELLKTRLDLARLVGKDSYAELNLQDKMAKHPNNVEAFLKTLLRHQTPTFESDIHLLKSLKQQEQKKSAVSLKAWDRDYYIQLYNQIHHTEASAPYFSVGSVIQGLSRLYTHLYGVHFELVSLQPGESWHNQVRKLDVICEQEGKIGTIYCDLFARPHKTTNAAHYTIRTSRRVDWDDAENDLKYATPSYRQQQQQQLDYDSLLPPVDTHRAASNKGSGEKYQLPVIALTCDFANNGRLSMYEVETLFHEMGHAMHSMLGRTAFHNVAGTRCASDFVELPSILMEHFVWHPQVLSLLLPKNTEPQQNHQQLLAVQAFLKQRKRFSGIEGNSQILMALVDQAYHHQHYQRQHLDQPGQTIQIWHHLQDEMGLFPSVPNTMWPVQFGHLFGYGSYYYSYLFDRTLAKRIWEKNFKSQPLDRKKGQVLRDELLKWGGAKDPWQCVADVLGGEDKDRIAQGDKNAMKTVGDWGIDA